MRLISLAAALSVLAAPVMAQDTPPPAAPAAGQSGSGFGVTVAATAEWLKGVGATVGEAQQGGGRSYLPVNDGRLDWNLWFYTCQADLCDDVQYSAIFTSPEITQEKVNLWNRDNRFIKAFYIAPTGDIAARAVAQYDVLLTANGVEQLSDTTATWANQLDKFANTMGFAPPPATVTVIPGQ